MMYLVTGGAGFIGSHLCKVLLAHGASVRILDDFSTGKLANVPHGVDVIMGDVADRDLVRHAVEGIQRLLSSGGDRLRPAGSHRLAWHPSHQPDRHHYSAGCRFPDPREAASGLRLLSGRLWRCCPADRRGGAQASPISLRGRQVCL